MDGSPRDVAQLVYAACQCACLVYDPLAQPGPGLVPVMSRAPSVTGTAKAVSMWKLGAGNTLIVSVRGTASAADHMVNMNAEPEDASRVLGLPFRVDAHRGFLSCAKALLPSLPQEIARQLAADQRLSHVVFTGHSAGGAVASLLFLHAAYNCLSRESPAAQPGEAPARRGRAAPRPKISLATFGSAPVTSADVTARAGEQPSVGWMLAFVNEFDMVPRADQPYTRSIVDLYRTRYGLPCRWTAVGGESCPLSQALCWTLPEPSHQLVGEVILSRSALRATRPTGDSASEVAAPQAASLMFIKVARAAFHNLVFCEVGVHKRRVYLERMRFLATGAWETPTQ
ncbi:hypothetical protein TOPH_05342 [Tolypocladium ophioglossoides CBS 100239]|uniref:sn-1-specific diacylglycerol lipase n=1 Tax=Tolypocladium ophioglossoides (strain CBS 100239) TaxID=1163406 RepID=A0A0L0N769_TOLOC|nr:hypothetical protein TOPH_05342 [Tolypocladium ophioglossoides CBS 100239]